MDDAVTIYQFTTRLPSGERFNLASQLARGCIGSIEYRGGRRLQHGQRVCAFSRVRVSVS